MMVADRRLVKISEAAKEFQIPVSTIRVWIRRGLLKAYRSELGERGTQVDANEIAAKRVPREVN